MDKEYEGWAGHYPASIAMARRSVNLSGAWSGSGRRPPEGTGGRGRCHDRSEHHAQAGNQGRGEEADAEMGGDDLAVGFAVMYRAGAVGPAIRPREAVAAL